MSRCKEQTRTLRGSTSNAEDISSRGGSCAYARHAGMTAMDPQGGFHDRHPLLPLKNVVVFPRNVVTLLVGRPRSVRALDQALTGDRRLIVTAHRDPEADNPRPEDL